MGRISLNLLPRLKFSIRADVLLLVAFIHLGTIIRHGATETNANLADSKGSRKITRELPAYASPIDSSSGGNPLLYNSIIHRILRDEEHSIYRNENVRWRKINLGDERLERRAKRDTANNGKIIDGDTVSLKATTTTTAKTSNATSTVQSTSQASIIANATSTLLKNSTKVLSFSNHKELYGTVRFSDLDLKTDQPTINLSLSDILVLNFSHNSIKQIDPDVVNAFPKLIRLDVSHNQLRTFNLTANLTLNGKLKLLDLHDNHLESFDGRHLRHLEYLDLSCNNIFDATKIDLDELSDLAYVDLSGNAMRRLHRTLFQNLTHLKVVRLAKNHLNKINKNYFFNLIDIEALILSNNNISEIENDTFAYLPNLQYLDLSYNQLDAATIRALQGIPDLITLSVAFNLHMGNALQGFVASWSLKELDASGTGLCQIPTALAQSVHTLNISYNHFQIIRCGDLDSYPLLQSLDVSSCHIMDIEDDALGRLEILITLHLNNNNITRVPSSLPTNLMNLYLQNNRITDIQPASFAQLVNLEVINLSGNQLMYLPGLPLPRLIQLDVRASGLKSLSQSVVKMSPNLKDLFLDGNPIKCTELLSIAEWATPCRSEKLFEFPADTDAEKGAASTVPEASTNVRTSAETIALAASIDFQSYKKQCTCRSSQQEPHKSIALNKFQCASEHLISPNRSANNKMFVSSEKQPLENDWNLQDESDKAMKPSSRLLSSHTSNSANSSEHATTATITSATEKEEINVKPTVNDVNSHQDQLSGKEISIEQKMNRLNDTGKQISYINHTNIVDRVHIADDAWRNISGENERHNDNAKYRNESRKNGPFVSNVESIAEIANIEQTAKAARVGTNSTFDVSKQKHNAENTMEKSTDLLPKHIDHSGMREDAKILRNDSNANIESYAANKLNETKPNSLNVVDPSNVTQTDNGENFNKNSSQNDEYSNRFQLQLNTSASDSDNSHKNVGLFKKIDLSSKANNGKVRSTNGTRTKDYVHIAKSDLIKSKTNEMPKKITSPEKKQFAKKIDANKTTVATANENASGTEAYQRDESDQIKATSIYQHEDEKRQQSKNQDTALPRSQKKDDDGADRKRYKLGKVNVRHDDKLDNSVVNSLAALAAATAAPTQAMTEQNDNNRLIPTSTIVASSNTTKPDIMEDVTLPSKYEANAQPEQQQQEQSAGHIDGNHEKNNSTTNWNTNKAISKMNGTKKVLLSLSTTSPPFAHGNASANAKTGDDNFSTKTGHKTNDEVLLTKTRASTSSPSSLKAAASVIKATTTAALTTANLMETIATEKSNRNLSSLLQKALPSEAPKESSAVHGNERIIYTSAGASISTISTTAIGDEDNSGNQKNENEVKSNVNNNKFSDSNSIVSTTSNKAETMKGKNEKAFANLNVRPIQVQDNKGGSSTNNKSTRASSVASADIKNVHISETRSTASTTTTKTQQLLATFPGNEGSRPIKISTNATMAKAHNNGNKSNEGKNMKIKLDSSNIVADSSETTLPTRIECNHQHSVDNDDKDNSKKCENNIVPHSNGINSVNSINKVDVEGDGEQLIGAVNKNASDKNPPNGQATYPKFNESKIIENMGNGDGANAAKSHHNNNVNRARQSEQLTMENLINRAVATGPTTLPATMILAIPLKAQQKPLVNGLAHNASAIDNDNQSVQTHRNINHPKYVAKQQTEEKDVAKAEQLLSNAKINSQNRNYNQERKQRQQTQHTTTTPTANEGDSMSGVGGSGGGVANNDQQSLSNTATGNGLSEQWNDIRTTSGHPGLFIVIGITIGVFVSLGLIHMYRCRKPCWQRQRAYSIDDDNHEPYAQAVHRDLLPMEVLNSTIRYTDAPIDLW